MIIMRGLPASGKSTEAKIILEQGNTVRINKDLLRTMLHFDKFTGKNEGLTRDASRQLAEYFLCSGINVIIDDTNLNPGTVQSWKDLAKKLDAKIEYKDLTHIPVIDCILRDQNREKSVGENVITKMALQYLDHMKGEAVVISDLDGTLCDLSHRKHFVETENKDWKSFFEGIGGDMLRTEVLDKVNSHKKPVILVSARPEQYRTVTENWLAMNHINYEFLIMREANDKRQDTEVKSDIYDKYLSKLKIEALYDDRPSVIRMWGSKGINVIDVGDGIEF